MSGIYIKGMEMPSACVFCPVVIDGGVDFSFCSFSHKRVENPMAVMHDCPLVLVPDHGDLIDRDETMNAILEEGGADYSYWYADIVNEMPIVIPADKEVDDG